MVAVMNGNDFTRKTDVTDDEVRSKSRVSDDLVNGNENTRLSEDIRVSRGEVADTDVNDIYREEGSSVDTVGYGDVRVSPELDNRAREGDLTGSFLVGGVVSMDNSRCEKTRVEDEVKAGDVEMRTSVQNDAEAQMVNGHEFCARNSETQQWKSGVTVGKGHVEVGKPKPGVSEYDAMISMFDEYAANDKGKAVGSAGNLSSVGYGYEIGDMVWGKVKSHPWWPGHIYDEAFASPSVRRTKREGHVLVAFFGDSSYGWFDPAELIPFGPNYSEKLRQTNMRTFVKAVEEAVDEASRRCGLALACRCRNRYNFRPTDVQGYFAVDLGDSEPAGVYPMTQIRKARESFRSRDTLAFVKQLAMKPRGDGHGGLEFIKHTATITAYRKAVFEEFDETYGEAFGSQPDRPNREPVQAVTQPSRAPLSGPMVFAETLGKKNSAKHNKAKDQSDNGRYLFKRRDEPNELKIPQTGQTTSSMWPSLVEGSKDLATGDYVLQKRAPALSPKQQIPAKLDRMFATEMNSPSASSQVTTIGDKPVTPRCSLPGSLASEQISGFGENYPVRQGPDYTNPLLEPDSSKSVEGFQQPPNFAAKVEQNHGIDVKFQGQDSRLRKETGGKKTILVKRPVGESVGEKSALGEKKKKRKKDLVTETSLQKRAVTGKAHPLPREDIRLENQKKDNGASSSLFRDSLRPPPATIDMGNLELKLPQLLDGLHALALNPFSSMERNSPAIIRQAFLNFRSHVYQKSLPVSSSADMESNEVPPPENVKDLPSAKPQKPLERQADPTKGGRKRVLSDRLEEMSVKRVKKIDNIKSLAVEKKSAERNLESQRDGKETMDSRRAKWFKPDPMKKKESLPKVREPTLLVMKFPPNTTLPSGFELKARLARFGPLNDSLTRILWKSSQVRVVFIHRADAEAAHRHLMGSNTLFGNLNMRCSIRPLEATATESETKVQREDGPTETPHLRDVDQRPKAALQLKSCLKKQVGDEMAAVAASGGNGGRGTPRVKFVLGVGEGSSGGEEMTARNNHFNINEAAATPATVGGGRVFPRVKFMSGGGENLMDTSMNNMLNNASFADGGASSSLSHGMDFISKNFQKGNLPPLLPLPQFQNAPRNLRYAETTHRTTHNFHAGPILNSVDIAPEMLNLLTKCSAVISNLVSYLGYVPYHPL